MNEAKLKACPYKEAVEMIGKICRSNKHKHPVSDIECECNRAIINAARAGERQPEAAPNVEAIAGSLKQEVGLPASAIESVIEQDIAWHKKRRGKSGHCADWEIGFIDGLYQSLKLTREAMRQSNDQAQQPLKDHGK